MQPTSLANPHSPIWTFDLSPITNRLFKKGIKDAPNMEEEFRKLAMLWYMYPQEDLPPSSIIDEFWHELIIDTKRYRMFCSEIFGKFIEHITSDEKDMYDEFLVTKSRYEEAYGLLPRKLWPSPGSSMPSRRK